MKKLFVRYALSQLLKAKTSERLWAFAWVVGRGLGWISGLLPAEMAASVAGLREPLINLLDGVLTFYVIPRVSSKAVKGPQGAEIP